MEVIPCRRYFFIGIKVCELSVTHLTGGIFKPAFHLQAGRLMQKKIQAMPARVGRLHNGVETCMSDIGLFPLVIVEFLNFLCNLVDEFVLSFFNQDSVCQQLAEKLDSTFGPISETVNELYGVLFARPRTLHNKKSRFLLINH